MANFDTTSSDKISRDFIARNTPFKRKVLVFGRDYSASPQFIFSQFCPAREADWINGWTAELIYTESGYAEPLCVFRTPASNLLGAGIWILNRVEPNRVLEATMLHDGNDILEHMRLDVVDLKDDRCNVTWTITLTAVSDHGNDIVDAVPEDTPEFVEELEYFVTRGALKPLAA